MCCPTLSFALLCLAISKIFKMFKTALFLHLFFSFSPLLCRFLYLLPYLFPRCVKRITFVRCYVITVLRFQLFLILNLLPKHVFINFSPLHYSIVSYVLTFSFSLSLSNCDPIRVWSYTLPCLYRYTCCCYYFCSVYLAFVFCSRLPISCGMVTNVSTNLLTILCNCV